MVPSDSVMGSTMHASSLACAQPHNPYARAIIATTTPFQRTVFSGLLGVLMVLFCGDQGFSARSVLAQYHKHTHLL